MLAYFEAQNEYCGFKPDFERQAIAAVNACVKIEAIDELRAFYRNQKQRAFKLITESQDKTGPERVDCSSETQKEWMRDVRKLLNDHIRDWDRKCRACLICRN
jgi:hypothetical protein